MINGIYIYIYIYCIYIIFILNLYIIYKYGMNKLLKFMDSTPPSHWVIPGSFLGPSWVPRPMQLEDFQWPWLEMFLGVQRSSP